MMKYKDVEEYLALGFLATYFAFLLGGHVLGQVPGTKKVQYDDEPHITLPVDRKPCPHYTMDIYMDKILFYESGKREPCMRILPDGSFKVERDSSCIECHKNPGEIEI